MEGTRVAGTNVNGIACMGGNRPVDVELLDRVAATLMEGVMRHGAHRVYLVGGSAQALLLSGLEGRPLTMRDVDVGILGIPARQRRITAVASELGLGAVSDFRPRPRGLINAGYGIYANHPQLGVIDLIFFASRSGLRSNGIFSVDTIAFRLDPARLPRDRAVSHILERLSREGAAPMIADGLILDRHDGIADLRARRIRLIRRGPYLSSVTERVNVIVRGLKQAAKWRVRLDDPAVSAICRDAAPDLREKALAFAPTRNLVKILTSTDLVVSALEEMRRIDALPVLFPELHWVARCDDRWDALVADLDEARRRRAHDPSTGSVETLDAVTRRMSTPEWKQFAQRLQPVLGPALIAQIEERRDARSPWMARIGEMLGGLLSRLQPVRSRRRASRVFLA
jgi:hypothetical protein